MSLKKMAVKMALAFAAAKGVQAFRDAGGMEGVKRKLAEGQRGGGAGGGLGGMIGRIGGSGGSSAGGLGNLLGSLGIAGPTGASEAGMTGNVQGQGAGSLGGLLGGLAGAAGGATGASRMRGLLDTTRETPVDTPEEENTAGLMIRAMIQAARADGEIDPKEREALMAVIGDSDPDETAFVEQQMAAPVDAEALARDVPKGHEVEVYTASVLAIEPDNRAEAEYLHALAEGLSLDKATVNAIHEAHNKPPLYTL
ncbi:hypothetical protein OCGS_0374 [Oceaniovalibus guishaninsula JLT2003]|uniref:Protein YebE n=1 Tax=Oceaniovalibus guishaninsula JLT2003 TaxID=1231392 RepID=K2HR99_9RHOB|nr:tellurite resistance TerB family protein [Oceaniovalibus guishaninsula]EKE45284.1 hypothetical protein OCGS_0374 [Oceaniovalibus guishaninsula JLT2003]